MVVVVLAAAAAAAAADAVIGVSFFGTLAPDEFEVPARPVRKSGVRVAVSADGTRKRPREGRSARRDVVGWPARAAGPGACCEDAARVSS